MSDLPMQDLNGDALLNDATREPIRGMSCPTLGGIPLLSRIAKGPNASVYRAWHPQLNREVAIKAMACANATSTERFNQFQSEIKPVLDIQSPYLAGLLQFGTEAGVFFVAMEYVEGTSAAAYLLKLLHRLKPGLPEGLALDLCIAGAEGVAASHRSGLLHRCLRPSSLLIPMAAFPNRDAPGQSDGQSEVLDFAGAKLCDLGMALDDFNNPVLVTASAKTGIPGYMAPEQWDGRELSKSTDVFSIGAILYTLLAGQTPFAGAQQQAIYLMTTTHEPMSIRTYRPDVSRATAAVLDTCLQKNPANRFENTDGLLEALRIARVQIDGAMDEQLAAVARINTLAAPRSEPAAAKGTRTEKSASNQPLNLAEQATAVATIDNHAALRVAPADDTDTEKSASNQSMNLPEPKQVVVPAMNAHKSSLEPHGAHPEQGMALFTDSPAICDFPLQPVHATESPSAVPAVKEYVPLPSDVPDSGGLDVRKTAVASSNVDKASLSSLGLMFIQTTPAPAAKRPPITALFATSKPPIEDEDMNLPVANQRAEPLAAESKAPDTTGANLFIEHAPPAPAGNATDEPSGSTDVTLIGAALPRFSPNSPTKRDGKKVTDDRKTILIPAEQEPPFEPTLIVAALFQATPKAVVKDKLDATSERVTAPTVESYSSASLRSVPDAALFSDLLQPRAGISRPEPPNDCEPAIPATAKANTAPRSALKKPITALYNQSSKDATPVPVQEKWADQAADERENESPKRASRIPLMLTLVTLALLGSAAAAWCAGWLKDVSWPGMKVAVLKPSDAAPAQPSQSSQSSQSSQPAQSTQLVQPAQPTAEDDARAKAEKEREAEAQSRKQKAQQETERLAAEAKIKAEQEDSQRKAAQAKLEKDRAEAEMSAQKLKEHVEELQQRVVAQVKEEKVAERKTKSADSLVAEARHTEETPKEEPGKLTAAPHASAAPAYPNEVTLELGKGVTMVFVLVPAGEFLMGASRESLVQIAKAAGADIKDYEDEAPAHRIKSTAIYIGKAPVTVAQFRCFASATHFQTGAEKKGEAFVLRDRSWQRIHGACWLNPGFEQTEDQPVVMLNWEDCVAFAAWAAQQTHKPLRLPTENEWEYAARGSKNSVYPWGDEWDGTRANHSDVHLKPFALPEWQVSSIDDGFAFTSPVGTFRNESWCGAVDMAGNVFQWCSDIYTPYPADVKSPAIVLEDDDVPREAKRPLRGGSYLFRPVDCRSAARRAESQRAWSCDFGMRLAFRLE